MLDADCLPQLSLFNKASTCATAIGIDRAHLEYGTSQAWFKDDACNGQAKKPYCYDSISVLTADQLSCLMSVMKQIT